MFNAASGAHTSSTSMPRRPDSMFWTNVAGRPVGADLAAPLREIVSRSPSCNCQTPQREHKEAAASCH
jgi:hypothetical protein